MKNSRQKSRTLSGNGVVARMPTIGCFGEFNGQVKLYWNLDVGNQVPPTKDLFSVPRYRVFESGNLKELLEDLKLLRTRQRDVLDGIIDNK